MTRLAGIAERLRSSLWFVPAISALLAFLLSIASLTVDRNLDPDDPAFFLFGGTAEGARSVLSTIAASMLTFTGLVFSITMLVLQLASSQLSPRVTRTFLRDRANQVVLGLFVATFLFTLLILRDVRSGEAGDQFVPGLSIWLAFLLLVASVGAFIYYIDHMAHSIRATTVIENIATETRSAIDRLYPEGLGEGPQVTPRVPRVPDPVIVGADASGALVTIDEDELLDVANELGTLVELRYRVGDFVVEGAPLFLVHGIAAGPRGEEDVGDRLRAVASLAAERTLQQDAAFGFRQLVDVAVRALSPGTNDPTTAVQVVDRLHGLLRRLVGRAFPSPVRLGDGGAVCLFLPRNGWDDYVRLAVDEIRLSARNQVAVVSRLVSMLEDLVSVAPPDRLPVLREELLAIRQAVGVDFRSERDQRAATGSLEPAGPRDV